MNREKTSSVMGLVISVLLHGIFFAGCLALDATFSLADKKPEPASTELPAQADAASKVKTNS
jgi:hypothetical protein